MMQNLLETNPKNEIMIPANDMISIAGNVAMLKSFRILIQLGRSVNESTLSWMKSPLTGSMCAGRIPSTGLNKPENMKDEMESHVIKTWCNTKPQ
jgi:hypothetical protein